ncbi:MAG: HlyD family secretion protein, partial [Nonlabens ulvanivorans]|uniref:HlyD family secretion protein n=1 Tax=Nonlabens ulvanivorans TaxID=906888 RepID=UPI0032661066
IVEAGDILFTLKSPELDVSLSRSQLRIDLLTAQINRAVSDSADRSQLTVLQQELTSEKDKYLRLTERQNRLHIKAPISGEVRDLQANLHKEQWLASGVQLARIVSSSQADVRGYIPAIERSRLVSGNEATFIADDPAKAALKLSLNSVSPVAADEIDLRVLTSVNSGNIVVDSDEQGSLKPRQPVYLVKLSPIDKNIEAKQGAQTIMGTVEIRAESKSFATSMFQQIARVLSSEISL